MNRFYESLCKSDFFSTFKQICFTKTEKELNADILKITMKIEAKSPELSKYIAEMPVTIPNEATPEITIKTLQEYYDSLTILLKDYDENHSISQK